MMTGGIETEGMIETMEIERRDMIGGGIMMRGEMIGEVEGEETEAEVWRGEKEKEVRKEGPKLSSGIEKKRLKKLQKEQKKQRGKISLKKLKMRIHRPQRRFPKQEISKKLKVKKAGNNIIRRITWQVFGAVDFVLVSFFSRVMLD